MTVRNLSFMMHPSSIVLVTAAHGSPSVVRVVAQNLLNGGFGGEVFAVSEEVRAIENIINCPDIESLPKPPDLAVIIAAPDSVAGLIARLGALGTKAAVVITAGMVKGGIERAQRLHAAILEAAKPNRLRIVGPGSLGIMVPGASLNASFAHIEPFKGSLAFIAQSGAVLGSVLDWATSRNIGFSHLIALGNMVDVDFGDMLDYLANDPESEAILIHAEAVGQVRKFMSAARLAARMKPVIVLKGGRHAKGGYISATPDAVEAQADAVYDAAFRRAGMLRVYDLQQLFDAVETLAKSPTVPGERLAILTNGRGIGVFAADALVDEGGRLAELSPDSLERLNAVLPESWSHGNPVDILGDADANRYVQSLEILLEDRGVDAVLVLNCPNALAMGAEIARGVIEAAKGSGAKKNADRLFTSWLGDGTAAGARRLFTEKRIPTYDTPNEAVRGFMQVVRFRRNREMLMQTPASIPEDFSPDMGRVRKIVQDALAERRTWLADAEAESVLTAYAIPNRSLSARDSAHQLMVGAFEDELFGPVIFFGHGGIASEVIQDKAFALPPLNMHLAREVMMRTRIYSLLEGRCGTLAADTEDIVLTLVKVSQLVCDVAEIAELEINPLLADEHGVSAAGARIRIAVPATPANLRLAIRPYPKELEETISLPDGPSLLLRPIRPEDEPAYHRLFALLPAEDVFMRFMSPMKVLSHNLAARLTQIDYDREMALGLFGKSGSTEEDLYGGVRISADPDNERAEFAILLRRDVTGMGLGPMMLRRIIQYARGRGVKEIFGEVLNDNAPMLELCKALGFSTKRMPEDPSIMIASLRL